MNKGIVLQSFLCLLVVSCSINEMDTKNAFTMSDEVFYASLESYSNPDTKVYVDENVKILWDEDDRITIFNKYTYNQEYRFLGETGDNAGGFRKVPKDDEFVARNDINNVYAVYPYLETTKISNEEVMTITLPSEQVYREGSFGPGANVMTSATEDNMLRFKNVGGYLVLKFYGEGVSISSIKLEGNNGELISGKSTITQTVGGNPTVQMSSTAETSVMLTCETPVELGATKEEATQFWLVVPPTSFTGGFTLTVTDADGRVFVKETSKNLSISRNGVLRISPIEVVPSFDGVIVPFEDAIFRAYCVKNFDTDGDGRVSYAEAQEVTSIIVCTDDITSLRGIEYFSKLQILICSGSTISSSSDFFSGSGQLYSLDVSKNTALTELWCNCNQLGSLDLSKNTALTKLVCTCNQLHSLDLSHNAALTFLECAENYLTDIDNSKNTMLSFLNCWRNQLTDLDVSNNTALTDLTCSENQLTSLDVSYNTALTDLDCSWNQLNSLDLSNNTALTKLSCVYNPLLSEIWLRKGQEILTLLEYDPNVTTIKYKDVPEAVDMGLSVKWASFNLGASAPEEFGDYYAWGETVPKDDYTWETYKWCMGTDNTMTNYCSNSEYGYNGYTDTKTVLDLEDDAAHVNLGGSWRMPTDAEWEELINNCTWTWTTQNGVYGRVVTAPNGNSIFLPAAGYRFDTDPDLDSVGTYGYYSSSSINKGFPYCAWNVGFYSGNVYMGNSYRCCGESVRPVYAE